MKKVFFLAQDQVELLEAAGLNVEICGSATYALEDYDGISFLEKRTMILQDILDVMAASELYPTLFKERDNWGCTISFGRENTFVGKTTLDAAFLQLMDAVERGLIASKFLTTK